MKVRLFNSKNIVFIFRYNIIARSIPFFFPSLSKTNSDKENYYCLDFIGVRLKTSSLRAFFFFNSGKKLKSKEFRIISNFTVPNRTKSKFI